MGCVQGKSSCSAHRLKDCCWCRSRCRCRCGCLSSSPASSSSSPSSRAAGSGEGPGSGGGRGDRSSRGRLRHVLSAAALGSVNVPLTGLCLQYASFTQRGHYPDSPDRANQDSFCVRTCLRANPNVHLFAVFDGHGAFGGQCAEFACDGLPKVLDAVRNLEDDPPGAFEVAFDTINKDLHESEIDDTMSGTTAIAVLVIRDMLYVANVGDSRAVAGVWNGETVVAEDLSWDQTPFRRDEYERVRGCGARVLSVDQLEGLMDPTIQNWGEEGNDEGDPPRLWVQDGMYPGTAFTRSVGDATAENIGVIALPEVKAVKITPNHLFFVVASDGVFEFLSSQAVVNMVVAVAYAIMTTRSLDLSWQTRALRVLPMFILPALSAAIYSTLVRKYDDPRDACSAIAAESYKLWLEHESRTDDITIIIVHIKDLCNSDDAATTEANEINKNTSIISGKVKVANCVAPVSGYRKEENSNQLNSSPPDLPVERNSCVAPSPTNYDHRNVINPD